MARQPIGPRVTVPLPDDLKLRLEAYAQTQTLSAAQVIRQAIKEYLDAHAPA